MTRTQTVDLVEGLEHASYCSSSILGSSRGVKVVEGKEGRLKARKGRALSAFQLSRAGLQLFSNRDIFLPIPSLFSECRGRCSLRRNSTTAQLRELFTRLCRASKGNISEILRSLFVRPGFDVCAHSRDCFIPEAVMFKVLFKKGDTGR